MIWTVILKSGENFVVNGSSYDLNDEVGKELRSRGEDSQNVAGIIQGNHPVRTYPSPFTAPLRGSEDFSAQRRAAMEAPTIRERESMDNVAEYPDFEQSFLLNDDRPGNDPLDW